MTSATKPTRLWEITDELAELAESIAEAGGEITPEIEAQLDMLEGALEAKVERIALVIREAGLDAEKAKAERQRLAAIEKHYAAKADGLRTYLLRCMTGAGVKRVETPNARVRVQKSGTPGIQYTGSLDDLPESFVRVVPESRSVDRKAITQAIRDGEDMPAGVVVTYSESVRIQ